MSLLDRTTASVVTDLVEPVATELEKYWERSGNDVKSIYQSTVDSWTGYLRQAGLIDGFSPLETVLSGKIQELSDPTPTTRSSSDAWPR